MSRPPRICFVGGVYHVTSRCNNKEFHFKNNSDFDLYLDFMERARKKYELEILGFVGLSIIQKPKINEACIFCNRALLGAYHCTMAQSIVTYSILKCMLAVEETVNLSF